MIIALAGTMDLAVIAEGVETRQQLEVLTRLGCDVYQGSCSGILCQSRRLRRRFWGVADGLAFCNVRSVNQVWRRAVLQNLVYHLCFGASKTTMAIEPKSMVPQ